MSQGIPVGLALVPTAAVGFNPSSARSSGSLVILSGSPGESHLTMNEISSMGYNSREDYDAAVQAGTVGRNRRPIVRQVSEVRRRDYRFACT